MWSKWRQVLGRTGALAALTSAVAITFSGDRKIAPTQDSSVTLTRTTTTEKNDVCRKDEKLLKGAIAKSRICIQRVKETTGAPGIVVAVSIDGETVWEEGFGHSDVENEVPCIPETVMRIASISKSITMSLVARCWEKGLLDMDKPVQEYVTSFPQKTYEGSKVTVTSRHLASHRSGIRHYKKKEEENVQKEEQDMTEFLSMQKYENVAEALKLFQDDPLAFEPGTKYLYTTHGYTLLSAVVEEVSKTPFPTLAKSLFKRLGMRNTYLDTNERIIYHRSKYYIKNKKGHLENAPYVDNSYKWAGGGFLSTVGDLIRFGNVMLYASQHETSSSADAVKQNGCQKCPSGFLKRETMESMWTSSCVNDGREKRSDYGMGWVVGRVEPQHGMCEEQRRVVLHTGGAMGASSTIFILLPKDGEQRLSEKCLPKGVVVALITNLINVGQLTEVAHYIAKEFDKTS